MQCFECKCENRAGAEFCAWCGVVLAGRSSDPGQAKTDIPEASEEDGVDQPDEGEATTASPGPSAGASPETARGDEPPVGGAKVEAEELLDATSSSPDDSPIDAGSPLHSGQILAHRYRIVEQIQSGLDTNEYRAHDLARCTNCAYEGNQLEDVYCGSCGASLDQRVAVVISEFIRSLPEEYDERFVDADREYFVSAVPPSSEMAVSHAALQGGLRLAWGHGTDRGLDRDHNEDYVDAWVYTRSTGDCLGLFVVADGLGGQDAGDVASRMATEQVWSVIRRAIWEPFFLGEALDAETITQRVQEAIGSANETVYDARMAAQSDMSTTITMALVVGEKAYIGNVGDSRTYLWSADGLQRITRDHSLVQRLVDSGEISPEEVYTYPQRNLIYQSIGDRPDVQSDVFRHDLRTDDALLLCSDGLWEMVRDEGIEEILLAESDPQRICERLVHNANLAGGEDNISVIVVQAKGSTRPADRGKEIQ